MERELRIDRAIYEADDEDRTYRFVRRNPDWKKLDAKTNMLNKRSIDGYNRIFRDGSRKVLNINHKCHSELDSESKIII